MEFYKNGKKLTKIAMMSQPSVFINFINTKKESNCDILFTESMDNSIEENNEDNSSNEEKILESVYGDPDWSKEDQEFEDMLESMSIDEVENEFLDTAESLNNPDDVVLCNENNVYMSESKVRLIPIEKWRENILNLYYEYNGFEKPIGMEDSIYENYFLNNIENNEAYVPVYVICESYTEESVKVVNTSMSDNEIKRRMKIANLIRFLTKGDTYTHTLISFDDSLTKMYSFDKEGMVTDNIEINPDWTYTNQIYIAVVFVTTEEKELMQKECEYLYKHNEDTKYAYFNFVKMLAGKGDKVDRRFVCSSFVGYILNKANDKNIHRDYINLRPEDMTILPRAFYVITVKNKDDFIKHKEDIRMRVKSLYDNNIEDIRDYNNYIPKIVFKDVLKKYDSVTEYLDKILKKGQMVPTNE